MTAVLGQKPAMVRETPPSNSQLRKRHDRHKFVAVKRASTRPPFELARSFMAACLSLAFLWTLALSISPQLHERIHSDAGQAEHSCAATLIASGNYHHSALPPLVK